MNMEPLRWSQYSGKNPSIFFRSRVRSSTDGIGRCCAACCPASRCGGGCCAAVNSEARQTTRRTQYLNMIAPEELQILSAGKYYNSLTNLFLKQAATARRHDTRQ